MTVRLLANEISAADAGSKAAVLENCLAVSTYNAMRRSINLSVYLVFHLEAGRFKCLGENLLGTGGVHFRFCPGVRVHKEITIALSLFRNH